MTLDDRAYKRIRNFRRLVNKFHNMKLYFTYLDMAIFCLNVVAT